MGKIEALDSPAEAEAIVTSSGSPRRDFIPRGKLRTVTRYIKAPLFELGIVEKTEEMRAVGLRRSCHAITECKSLGQCQVIDKTQVSHLLQTLSHIKSVQ